MPKLNPQDEARKFFNALEPQPFSALLKLCKFFRLAPTTPEAKALIDELPAKLRPQNIEKLLGSLEALSEHERQLLDSNTKQSIKAFKRALLSDPKWASLCSASVLERLGTQSSLLPWVIIRLIEQSNPDQAFNIPLEAIEEAESEQTHALIANKLKSANLLPMRPLLNLVQSEQSANEILALLASHPQVYELGKKMVDKLPALAPQLAMQWSLVKATVPMEAKTLAQLNRCSKALEHKHPEFKTIQEAQRTFQQPMSKALNTNPYFRFINFENGAALAWSLLNAPSFYRFSHACYVGARTLLYHSAGPSPAALGLSALMLGARFATPVATYAAGKKMYQKYRKD